MTSTTLEGTSGAISATAARLATGAIVSYQVLLVVLIFLRPDLGPSWHTISEWAIGPYGWIMSGGFLLSALSYAALFVMLNSQLRDTMGRIGLGILLMCVIALAFPLLEYWHASYNIRHEPVSAISICCPAHQPQPRSQEQRMGTDAHGFALDRWFTAVRLRCFRPVLGYFCVSLGSASLWSRR
jgi:Protein of unknown function (DUF998)